MIFKIADARPVIAYLIDPTFGRTRFRIDVETCSVLAADAARFTLLVVEARPVLAADAARIALLVVEACPIIAVDASILTFAIILVIRRIG